MKWSPRWLATEALRLGITAEQLGDMTLATWRTR